MNHALPPAPELWRAARADAVADRLTPAAHWYFQNEWLTLDPAQQPSLPIWLAAPDCLARVQLDPAARQFAADTGQPEPFLLIPALDSNPTFINEATLAYLARQPVRVRAIRHNPAWQLRTIWPSSWRLDAQAPLLPSWSSLVPIGEAGAQRDFLCHALWRRASAAPDAGRWAIGFMLNGAQGDDDEAHGGHFALTIGRYRDDGDIADWLVANFYNPDVVSEKGILPALVPMDNYLADLNSGQQQYRPSWLVCCVLSDADIASALYRQLIDTLHRLYDHRLHYQHTDNNCTGLSMDALRAIGLTVPLRGPSSRLLAPLLYLSTLLRERSGAEARKASRYLLSEQTRLMPWQAFEACVDYTLALLTGARQAVTPTEASFCRQTQVVYGLHFPQLPSARPWGREPARSIFDYQSRVPKKRRDWKIIPVPARELPLALRYGNG